jgi:hypothetical protein
VTQAATGIGGPISVALESELRTCVRRHGIVLWLDLDNHYSAFVNRLAAARQAGALPYEVRAFRGSHLALMMSMDGIASGTEKVPLVIHLPGFNEDTVSRTPLLELYRAGTRYRKSLDTLVTEAAAGRVNPDQIAATRDRPGLTLDAADSWLTSLLKDDPTGFTAQLREMKPTALFDDLLTGGFISGRIGGNPVDQDALWEQLSAWTGLPTSWRDTTLPTLTPGAEDVAFAAASWSLCVEYVDDLKRPPVSPQLLPALELPRPVIDTCKTITNHLRERHATFYQRTADETEALLVDEVDSTNAEVLGKIDTFRFKETKVLRAALAALDAASWDEAAASATTRLEPKPGIESFWLRDDPARKSMWQLVFDAARLGQAIVRAGEHLPTKGGLDTALEVYANLGAAVDLAHRHLEQRRAALLYPQLPEFETLRARLDGMRRAWRHWADAWSRDFNMLCRTRGFLPAATLQQRTLFDEVVKPMTQEAGTTAFFVVDAFRFEMGEELYRQLIDTPAATVHIKARLAELPTVTEIGMNVLAPVATNGRLNPALSANGASRVLGFSTGEFRVSDPETRKRAMHGRVGGATCPLITLDDVVQRNSASLKRSVAQARLLVVHSQEIDNAGENSLGPDVFDRVMQKLRAAWRLLRDAGVRRFVFTADHGFLLLDESAGAAQTHGRRIDPKHRHVFSPVAADHAGEVRVALADLGYEGAQGYVIFPETTAVFDTGRRLTTFVHGGNSLQERVIPVLTVVHRAAAGGSTLEYCITGEAREGIAGMHCLEIKVDVAAQLGLDFGTTRDIEVALRVPDVDGVQVELCQTRGKARIADGAVQATVGERFELFFRLSGSSDARVLVELHHPSAVAVVQPCRPHTRFAVMGSRPLHSSPPATADATAAGGASWLDQLPETGVRQVFEHLATHGTVTENEAATLLGGPRALRRFAIQFEVFTQRAPFGVRIDVVAGVKRYVREGSR